ncbi:hypothetical protein YW7DRAFT_05604 [Streptomyces sp. AmelKG-E11A]|nr:hypothetical protein YW7DRAFT_05604 [Streptomyces sp. AmelKG-E11A]
MRSWSSSRRTLLAACGEFVVVNTALKQANIPL